MSTVGSGFIPAVTIVEVEKPNGKTYVNLQISVGNIFVKFDPTHWESLVKSGNIIHNAAMQRRTELVEKAREEYEDEY